MKTFLKLLGGFLVSYALFGLAVIVSLLFMVGCGVSNKNSSSEKHKLDSLSTAKVSKESNKSNDSLAISKSKEKASADSSAKTVSGFNIVFTQPRERSEGNSSGSETPMTPVVIKDTDSGLYIDPGGRSIKSVSGQKAQKTSSKSTSEKDNVDSGHVRKTENEKVDTTGQTRIKASGASEDKSAFSFEIPWYGYAIGGIIIAGLFYLWFTGRMKKAKQDPVEKK